MKYSISQRNCPNDSSRPQLGAHHRENEVLAPLLLLDIRGAVRNNSCNPCCFLDSETTGDAVYLYDKHSIWTREDYDKV